ncbi:holo-[acyl-carrier-protein] synthase [Desulfovibrio sp.]|uniref:holo-[acyl-carrier-protein] synthase n=1 Tax=Desulfovibrio sp. TaxID=885 RepID=UPI0025BFD6F9|nr:holo-[acyl-carrier-protein] synthase [Desulfovibrio sp.]MCI7569569.1 holo-[acyl-carrier-protein] synthase [Desulfovibrio sp.]
MIIGLGLDVTELPRIARMHEKYGDAFLKKLLTPNEQAHVPAAPVPFLAGRFAAKEAAVKALGSGFSGGIGLHDIEILPSAAGKPLLHFHGPAAALALRLEVEQQHVTITHDRHVAAAVVILESA